MTKFRFPELRACPQFWKTGQPSSPTEDQCYFFMMQFSKIEGMPSIPEIWPASHPVQRKVLFWGGKTQKKSAKFFLQLPDTYKKYILQKKWSKTDIPALSSGLNNLHPAIWGCHHQLYIIGLGQGCVTSSDSQVVDYSKRVAHHNYIGQGRGSAEERKQVIEAVGCSSALPPVSDTIFLILHG